MARLLSLVEEHRQWPDDSLAAYVAMIPKATGGSRLLDQRPITVLEVLYRLWAKGVVQEWQPVLQHSLLGHASFGFRAQTGMLHAAQLLEDVIHQRRSQHQELWLASFDIAKCYDSLPWWAVFRVLQHAGVRPSVVACFLDFYRRVRRRFRYGALDGTEWYAANGLAQGCPASPDLLNILFEPFHRWAGAQDFGVSVAGLRLASVSFADDLALLGGSRAAIARLITAYLDWCTLLGLQVSKIQIWSSLGPGLPVSVGTSEVLTSSSFRFVGIELGLPEPLATEAHLKPRLAKALATTQRLRTLQLPASLCS